MPDKELINYYILNNIIKNQNRHITFKASIDIPNRVAPSNSSEKYLIMPIKSNWIYNFDYNYLMGKF